MYIESIELKDFRNYEDFSYGFDPGVNLIAGRNAQGKTNLIEGICLSSIGRSFRTVHDNELIRFGAEMAQVRVKAQKKYVSTKVEIRINKSSKKQIKKDGVLVHKTSQLIDNILIVVFSPDDLRIVKEEPEKRRKFIDRELAQIKPAYYQALAGYKKALLQRNTYLKEESIDFSLLDLWNEQLVNYGSDLIRMRKDFVEKINVYSGRIHNSITAGRENLKVEYISNIPYCEDPADQREMFRKELREAQEKDVRLRTTSCGPHKDDLHFFLDGINVRYYGSQGQQRTCALSLKLAELDFIREETGEEAILLLDDVMSELDEERRKYLVRTLSGTQLFITMTDVDPDILEMVGEAKIILIENGKCVNGK